MENPKPPILEYEVRKVMPMSRKVLLLATSGAAAIGTIVVAGVVYRPVAVPVAPLSGDVISFSTTWQSSTRPVSAVSMPGTMPSILTNWRSTTQPASGDAANDPPPFNR